MRLFLGRAPTLLTVLAVKNNFFGGCGRCNSCRTLSFVITSKVLPIIKSDLEERSRNDVYWSRDPDFIISYLNIMSHMSTKNPCHSSAVFRRYHKIFSFGFIELLLCDNS